MAASVEEVSYELGGAMGIAVLGSLMSALYTWSLHLPDAMAVAPAAYDSLDEALIIAATLPSGTSDTLQVLARQAFNDAFTGVIAVATILMIATALGVRHFNRKVMQPAA